MDQETAILLNSQLEIRVEQDGNFFAIFFFTTLFSTLWGSIYKELQVKFKQNPFFNSFLFIHLYCFLVDQFITITTVFEQSLSFKECFLLLSIV